MAKKKKVTTQELVLENGDRVEVLVLEKDDPAKSPAKTKKAKEKKPKIKKWVLRAQVISALKKIFVRSPMFQIIKKANRRERVTYRKDGSVSDAQRWEYQCACCKQWFPEKIKGEVQIQIDHMLPTIDPETGFVDWNTWIEREFVGVEYWDEVKGTDKPIGERLQVLCVKCHNDKSQIENKNRREVKKEKRK